MVVHVFSPNDVEDLYAFLSDAAMQAFISEPLDHITYPPRADPARLIAERERKMRQRPFGKRLEEDLYVMKMFRWLGSRYREWRPACDGRPHRGPHRTAPRSVTHVP